MGGMERPGWEGGMGVSGGVVVEIVSSEVSWGGEGEVGISWGSVQSSFSTRTGSGLGAS